MRPSSCEVANPLSMGTMMIVLDGRSGGDKELRNFSFKYVRTAKFPGVPKDRTSRGRCFSIRSRVRSNAADGSDLSSYEIKRTFTAVDPATLVDHLKIRASAFNCAEDLQAPAKGITFLMYPQCRSRFLRALARDRSMTQAPRQQQSASGPGFGSAQLQRSAARFRDTWEALSMI